MSSDWFKPLFTPYQMLELGVFDGTYFKGNYIDFEKEVLVSPDNLFMENASQPMSVWLEKGWITEEDPLGWYQWYTRYFHGRRLEELDKWQMNRWKSFVARHSGQVLKNGQGDMNVRRKQRQALLHWGADPIPDIEDVGDKFKFLMEYKNQLTYC